MTNNYSITVSQSVLLFSLIPTEDTVYFNRPQVDSCSLTSSNRLQSQLSKWRRDWTSTSPVTEHARLINSCPQGFNITHDNRLRWSCKKNWPPQLLLLGQITWEVIALHVVIRTFLTDTIYSHRLVTVASVKQKTRSCGLTHDTFINS